ncbi:MAG: N-acetylmuramoyl-L-alanine amidase [Rhodobacteraceae bacterium]|nr:N-acetylmuramoyl-L-alanine amidase [Paracoccaceae bacterium]
MSSLAYLRAAIAVIFTVISAAVCAQDFNALARLDTERSAIRPAPGGVEIDLHISQPVPWRVFTIDNPPRVVMDFSEIDWASAPESSSDLIDDIRVGALRPGWSRLVLGLADPALVEEAELTRVEDTGQANIRVRLAKADATEFARRSGVPREAEFPRAVVPAIAPRQQDTLRVVLDPGHGGIDPGAEFAGVREVDLMLLMARALEEALLRSGIEVVLTRDGDIFVPLERRIAIANEVEADLFVSLHADSLAEGAAQARGATVYTLADRASDAASQALAERHDRDDLLAGVDLSGQEDEIALVLMEIARRETTPKSHLFADMLVASLKNSDLSLTGRPRREAAFSVLKSPDIPSVLIELGFLTSDRDRANLTDPEWRSTMANAIRDTIVAWANETAIRDALIRN